MDILDVVKEVLQKDEYVEKIKKHYKLFKDKVDRKPKIKYKDIKKLSAKENTKTIIKESQSGRNDLCPCGSGKKYKKCCGK